MSFTIFELAEALYKAGVIVNKHCELSIITENSKQLTWDANCPIDTVVKKIKEFSNNIHFGKLKLPDTVELSELILHKQICLRYINDRYVYEGKQERYDILIFKS